MDENPYRSSTTDFNYSKDHWQLSAISQELRSAIKVGLLMQLLRFLFTLLILDFGRSNQECSVAIGAQWLVVLLIYFRRKSHPTQLDLLFVRYGVFPLWLVTPMVAELVWMFIGRSTESGIDRWF